MVFKKHFVTNLRQIKKMWDVWVKIYIRPSTEYAENQKNVESMNRNLLTFLDRI